MISQLISLLTEVAISSGSRCCCLQSGKTLASEKTQFESRLRRMKLGCSRWKVAYQKEVHDRYQEMASALEERYST